MLLECMSKSNGTKECQCVNRCTRIYSKQLQFLQFFFTKEKMKGRKEEVSEKEEVRTEWKKSAWVSKDYDIQVQEREKEEEEEKKKGREKSESSALVFIKGWSRKRTRTHHENKFLCSYLNLCTANLFLYLLISMCCVRFWLIVLCVRVHEHDCILC